MPVSHRHGNGTRVCNGIGLRHRMSVAATNFDFDSKDILLRHYLFEQLFQYYISSTSGA